MAKVNFGSDHEKRLAPPARNARLMKRLDQVFAAAREPREKRQRQRAEPIALTIAGKSQIAAIRSCSAHLFVRKLVTGTAHLHHVDLHDSRPQRLGEDRREPGVDRLHGFESAQQLVLPQLGGNLVELARIDQAPSVVQAMRGDGDRFESSRKCCRFSVAGIDICYSLVMRRMRSQERISL